jgi:hypothetical protein
MTVFQGKSSTKDLKTERLKENKDAHDGFGSNRPNINEHSVDLKGF